VYANEACGTFADGLLSDLSISIAGSRRLGSSTTWGLGAALGYRRVVARYTASPLAPQRLLDPTTGQVIDLSREFRFDQAAHYIDLSLQFIWRALPHLSIGVGPVISASVNGSFEQTDNILAPGDRSFADGERVHGMDFGIAVSRAPFVAGATASASWDIPIDVTRTLSPAVNVRWDATSAVRESSWQRFVLGASLALMFDIGQETVVDTVRAPLVPVSTTPPPPPAPNVAINATGIDESGVPTPQATISVREVVLVRSVPVVPVVFFDSASSTPAPRYPLLTAGQAAAFSEYDIAELGPIDLAHRVLSVVGLRMRNDRGARVHLYPSASLDEPQSIVAERSKYVRDYLVNVWGIDARRIEVRPGSGNLTPPAQTSIDGRIENRRVVFGSNSPFLLGPLVTERLIREFNPPRLQLVPTVSAPAGVLRWRVAILHDGVEMASFGGTGAVSPEGDSLTWRLDDRHIDSTLGDLVSSIEVVDSLGRTAHASDTVQLRLRKESRMARANTTRSGEVERQIVELAGFDYRSASGGNVHIEALREIVRSLRNGATIDVTGYTDRIGDDDANVRLSSDRAAWVGARLRDELALRGVAGVTIRTRGAGLVVDRFSNDLPEGRILSRGARLVIEQAIGSDAPR